VASDDCPKKSATVDMNTAALQYFSQITVIFPQNNFIGC